MISSAKSTEMVKQRSDAVDPTARWDTLVLSDETMNTLQQISRAVRNMEDRLKRGLEPPRGAVLFGPPGTGKTQIARTLANESGVQFVSATAKDVKGQYRGESIQKVGKLFADARKKSPCILFLDEFDNATKSRARPRRRPARGRGRQPTAGRNGRRQGDRATGVRARRHELPRTRRSGGPVALLVQGRSAESDTRAASAALRDLPLASCRASISTSRRWQPSSRSARER